MSMLGYSDMISRGAKHVASAIAVAEIPILESDSFPKQWEYITAVERFKVQWSGRRAAKTSGARMRTEKLAADRPGRRVLYINQTATNADQQFFKPLLKSLDARHVPYRADNSDLMVYWGNGSFMRAMGCNNVAEVKKKLGDYWDEVIVDEMQSYADEVLYELIDRAILPTMIDKSGSATFQGTPPVTKAGFWYKLLTESTFRKFHWTLFDNPYIHHDAEAVYGARGIKTTDAVYQREVLGEIYVDPNAVVFKYESPRNDIGPDGRPEPNHPAWCYVLGVDLGFSDSDAMVVLGWRRDDKLKRIWECFSWQENHLDYLKLADKFKAVVEKWCPQEICVDTGGHGARKIMESLRSMFSIYKFRLKPASVLDSIALMNDDFRTGRFQVAKGGLIAHDAALVVWKHDKHEVEISETFHSDIMAATRYAHSCAYHYLAEPDHADQELEESDEDRRVRQWMERREMQMDPHNPYRH